MTNQYDIIIVGGGLVGLSLAALLASSSETKLLKIALIEADKLSLDDSDPQDTRSIALAYRSRMIYERRGLWSEIEEKSCPITDIHVSQQGSFGTTRLHAVDHQIDALGYVIKSHQLKTILLAFLQKQHSVTLIQCANVQAIDWINSQRMVSYKHADQTNTLVAQLVVLAGGMQSELHQKLAFDSQTTAYGQSAIVATINHEKPHQHVAYERFTSDGAVALLPLEPNVSALIWTVSDQRLALLSLIDADFLAQLQQQFGYRLGKFMAATRRQSFPICQRLINEPFQQGLLVLGNAAHTVHPVAGQGYNLSLRDADCLTDLLNKKQSGLSSMGELAFLRHYQQQRQSDQQKIIMATHQLIQLFSMKGEAFQHVRASGLVALDLLPGLKRWFGQHAMGL